MNTSAIPRFVVILDQAGARHDISEVAVAAIRGGVDIVQVREKWLPPEDVVEIAKLVISAVSDPTRVAVNGYPEIAADLGTHLHLPDEFMFDRASSKLASGALVSSSIHGHCHDLGADYVILGNVLPTASKPGKAGIRYQEFERVVRDCPCPVLAIGGIGPAHVAEVMKRGAHGVAVRSFVIESDHPEQSARAIRTEIDRWTR